jgi:hypothetical protein
MANPMPDDELTGPHEDNRVSILVWAADAGRSAALVDALRGEGRTIQPVLDGDMATLTYHRTADLLVAEDGAGLAAQLPFIRIPLILVRRPDAPSATPRIIPKAYAIVARAAEATLAVDRFIEHRRLSERATARREPPRQCSRCGRGYDPMAGRKSGVARKFVRFGAISLCGGCVEELRNLIQHAETPFVEAERRR